MGDGYQALDAAYRRGLESPTPPPRRHRLLELIDFARDAAGRLESDAGSATVELDGNALADLVTTASVFDRWRYHPAYRRIVSSLQNADDVQHAVMTLLVASYLVDGGNGVGVVDDNGVEGRIPDIWVTPTVTERLDLEVKTPLVLRALGKLPSHEEAVGIIESQLDEAASSKRGQLNPANSGIVAIGAFHMGQGGLDILEAATRFVLDRQRAQQRKPHVAAVLLCELSYHATTEIDAAGRVQRISFVPTMDHRLVYHPGYSGGLTITEGTPWSTWKEEGVLEQGGTRERRD